MRLALKHAEQRKATATQVSASSITVPLMFAAIAECGGDFLVARPLPDQALDDGRRDLGGYRPYIAHRPAAVLCDRLLGRGNPVVELCLEPLMQLLGFASLLVARGAGNGLGAASRVRERLFVGRLRRVRLLFPLCPSDGCSVCAVVFVAIARSTRGGKADGAC